jgi:hypothetical protein
MPRKDKALLAAALELFEPVANQIRDCNWQINNNPDSDYASLEIRVNARDELSKLYRALYQELIERTRCSEIEAERYIGYASRELNTPALVAERRRGVFKYQ